MARVPKAVKKPAHRPKKKIDWEEVDKYLLAQVPGTWIAASIGVHPETLYDRCLIEKGSTFSDYSQSKMSHGKSIGMMKQFQGMLKGNTQLTLHFAAHHLGQSTKSEIKQDIKQQLTTIEILPTLLELPENGHSNVESTPAEDTSSSGTTIQVSSLPS